MSTAVGIAAERRTLAERGRVVSTDRARLAARRMADAARRDADTSATS